MAADHPSGWESGPGVFENIHWVAAADGEAGVERETTDRNGVGEEEGDTARSDTV